MGTYAINASGAVDSNYTITYVPGALTIAPAVLNVSPNNLTAVYGAAYPSLTATFAGAASGRHLHPERRAETDHGARRQLGRHSRDRCFRHH